MTQAPLSTLALILVVAGASPCRSGAQTVYGTVEDELGQVVTGALVILRDSSGGEVARIPTDFDGRFVLQGENEGQYFVKVLRIGFQPWTSPYFYLTSAPYSLSARVSQIRVTLPPITVEMRNQCEAQPTDGVATATLWEAVSVALANNRWAMERRLYRFRTTITQRAKDRFGVLEGEETDTVGGYSSWPFQSIDPDQLSESGFVQGAIGGPIYYGPDTDVLFSDSFLAQHCWGLATREVDNLIGLTFVPTTDRHVPDIEGALWLDRESLELRQLDFLYTGLESWVPGGSAGGHYEFHKLPNGSWILNSWRLRAPRSMIRPGIARRKVVGGYAERYGEVIEVRTTTGEILYRP